MIEVRYGRTDYCTGVVLKDNRITSTWCGLLRHACEC
jgi:hypothetical protein